MMLCCVGSMWMFDPASGSGGLTDLRDRPLYLPAYDGLASMAGVTGTVSFRVQFRDGKVRSVEPVSTQLAIPPTLPGSQNLKSLILKKLGNAVKRWDCIFLQPFEAEVVFELRQAELPGNQRTYELEYNGKGVVTRVVITDPLSSRQLGKQASGGAVNGVRPSKFKKGPESR